MWTLAEARARLGVRLAEASTAFWDDATRNAAINEGQRFVCAATKRLKASVTGEVSVDSPSLTFTRELTPRPLVTGTCGGVGLAAVPMELADLSWPAWRAQVGAPRHLLVDARSSRVTVAPAPSEPTQVTVSASVLAEELLNDSQRLFDDASHMAAYQDALLNHAAGVCLLRERYDGDAERFFSLALSQLALEVPRVDG